MRAALGVAGLEVRTTVDEWARRYDDGETSSLVDLHREVRTRMTSAISLTSRA